MRSINLSLFGIFDAFLRIYLISYQSFKSFSEHCVDFLSFLNHFMLINFILLSSFDKFLVLFNLFANRDDVLIQLEIRFSFFPGKLSFLLNNFQITFCLRLDLLHTVCNRVSQFLWQIVFLHHTFSNLLFIWLFCLLFLRFWWINKFLWLLLLSI